MDPTNTPEWYSQQSQLWDSQKDSLTRSLEDKTKEALELMEKCQFLSEQLEQQNGIISNLKEQVQRARDMSLSGAGSEELIGRLRGELSEAKSEVSQLESKLEKTKKELEIAQDGGADFSVPLENVPQLPDNTVYKSSTGLSKDLSFYWCKAWNRNNDSSNEFCCSSCRSRMRLLLLGYRSPTCLVLMPPA